MRVLLKDWLAMVTRLKVALACGMERATQRKVAIYYRVKISVQEMCDSLCRSLGAQTHDAHRHHHHKGFAPRLAAFGSQ